MNLYGRTTSRLCSVWEIVLHRSKMSSRPIGAYVPGRFATVDEAARAYNTEVRRRRWMDAHQTAQLPGPIGRRSAAALLRRRRGARA